MKTQGVLASNLQTGRIEFLRGCLIPLTFLGPCLWSSAFVSAQGPLCPDSPACRDLYALPAQLSVDLVEVVYTEQPDGAKVPQTLPVTDCLWQAQDREGNWVTNPQGDAWHAPNSALPPTLPDGAVAVPPGKYKLLFQIPRGYATPEPVSVVACGGTSVRREVTLQRIPTYDTVLEIPPQTAWHGRTLEFLVTEPVTSFLFDQHPDHPDVQRDISFDAGLFTYRPSDRELRQFRVTLTGAGGETSAVVVTPRCVLRAEQSVLEFKGNLPPEEESGVLVHVEEEKVPWQEPSDWPEAVDQAPNLTSSFNYREKSCPACGSACLASCTGECDGDPTCLAECEELCACDPNMLRSVRISGKQVVFEGGNQLYRRFAYSSEQHCNDDVRRMEIYADTVVIRCQLHLPGTDVTIYARELRFEDPGDGETAAIVTTPVELEPVPDDDEYYPGEPYKVHDWKPPLPEDLDDWQREYETPGNVGLPAGALALNVGSVYAPGAAKRFVLKGGNGQKGEEGHDGSEAPGYTKGEGPDHLPPLGEMPAQDLREYWEVGLPDFLDPDFRPVVRMLSGYYWTCAGCGYIDQVRGMQTHTSEWIWWFNDHQPDLATRHGYNAIGDGRHGRGGNGGGLSVPDFTAWGPTGGVLDISRQDAGATPEKRERLPEQGDHPERAVHAERRRGCVLCVKLGWEAWTFDHEQDRGDGVYAPALEPAPVRESYPQPGQVRTLVDPLSWLHPLVVRSTLQYAKDAYLNGYLDVVREVLEPYAAGLEALEENGEITTELFQLQGEIATILHRLDNHLDYFGYPAGWVPMLSFEVTDELYRQEVAAAADTLFLTYYLGQAADMATDQAAALRRLEDELSAEIRKLTEPDPGSGKSPLEETQDEIERLERDARDIDGDIAARRRELKEREDALRESAKLTVTFKKALRVTGSLLTVIPVSQPALGLIGTGMTVASRYNEADPLDLAIEATSLAGAFLDSGALEKFTSFSELATSHGGSKDDQKNIAEQVRSQAGELCLKGGIQVLGQVLQEAKSWERDLDDETRRLAAEDEIFQDLVEQIRRLNKRKRLFAEELAVVLQTAQDMMDRISHNSWVLASGSFELCQLSGRIDQEAFRYIQDTQQRIRDRLLKFKYYMVKAYQCRMLQVYPNRDAFNLDRITDWFFENYDWTAQSIPQSEAIIDTDSFMTFYRDELQDVASSIGDMLMNTPFKQSGVRNYTLSAEELAQLNDWDRNKGERPGESGADLRINLVGLQTQFSSEAEDIRILDIRLAQDNEENIYGLAASPKPGSGEAIVQVTVKHSGESLLTSGGQTFRFNHYRNVETPRINWTFEWQPLPAPPGYRLQQFLISPDEQSLLNYLISGFEGAAADLSRYARPAAWADLIFTKETLDPASEMQIDMLSLDIVFEYRRKREFQAELEVSAVSEDGASLPANILVDTEDENGRSHGCGALCRVYDAGMAITVEAHELCGGHQFDRWVDAQGQAVGEPGNPVLTINLPSSSDPSVSRYSAVYAFGGSPGAEFTRGDSNADGNTDLSDAVFVLNYLFLGGAAPSCDDAADADDNGALEITDAVYLLNFLFLGGPRPAEPFPSCGPDRTIDELACVAFEACESP